MNSRYFEFDNIKSADMNYHIVNFPEDFYERTTYGGRNINVGKNSVISIEEEPLQLTITIAKMDNKDNLLPFDNEDISELSRWLIKDEFRELRFGNDINKVYYAMVTDMSSLNVDRVEQGYLDITFLTSSSTAFTNPKIDFIDVVGEKEYEVIAEFDVGEKHYPVLKIKAKQDTDLVVKNLGTNQTMVIEDIREDEVITIDCDMRIIYSDDPLRNVFKNFNREWLYLRYGSNILQIVGDVELVVNTQYETI